MLSKLRDEQTPLALRTRVPGNVAGALATGHQLPNACVSSGGFAVCVARVCAARRVVLLLPLHLAYCLALFLGLAGLVNREGVAVYVVARFLYEWMESAELAVNVFGESSSDAG